MKKIHYLWLLGSLTVLPACVTPASHLAIQPVGPDPHAGRVAINEGYLMVYSAWSAFNNNYTTDHSGYKVLADDGRLVKRVPNYIFGDFTSEPPTRVTLPPGSYRVRAESQDYGIVEVPVVVEAGAVTRVYLDCDSQPSGLRAARGDLVKLPDGQIVGWAANATAR